MAIRKRRTSSKRGRSVSRRRVTRTPRRTARAAKAQVIKIVIENPQAQPQLPFGQPLPASVGTTAAATRKARF